MEMHADDEFSQCFDYASGATAERFQNPLWPVTELITGYKLRKSIAVVKDFGRRIVASAVQDRTARQTKADAPDPASNDDDDESTKLNGSLIQSLLDAISDEQTAADAALTYLSAGRDTTGQALTWAFYLLLQHPSAVAKIRAEVDRILDPEQQYQYQQPQSAINPSYPNPTLFTPLTCPYATAVFYETLRLYPPIPFEIRQAQSPTTLPDGTHLPQGSVLVWCLWAMQRSARTWGADADEFRPERFLDADGRFVLGKSASEFPVFYGGARSCLGRKMAEAVAAQVIPVVVWGFEMEGAWEGSGGRRSKTSLTLPMEGGLPVRVGWRRRGGD